MLRAKLYERTDLKVPEAYIELVRHYARTPTDALRRSKIDESPFKRYVDLWFLAVMIGALRGKARDVDHPYKFVDGTVLASDPQRIDLLEMLAIGQTGNPSIIEEPKDVIELANQFAAGGLPEIVSMLEDGNQAPIWNLTDALMDLVGQRN